MSEVTWSLVSSDGQHFIELAPENLRLMMAARDLLATLKFAIRACKKTGQKVPCIVCDRMSAAIAKAEGTAPLHAHEINEGK